MVIWTSGTVLAKYLYQIYGSSSTFVLGKRCLELGAGCSGIPGLYLVGLGAKEVYWTDLEEIIPLLKKNIDNNFGIACSVAPSLLFPSSKTIVVTDEPRKICKKYVYKYKWGDVIPDEWNKEEEEEEEEEEEGEEEKEEGVKEGEGVKEIEEKGIKDRKTKEHKKFDIIVGTDVVFSINQIDPLLYTILNVSTYSTVCFLAYEVRCHITRDYLFKAAKEYSFYITKIPKKKYAKIDGGDCVEIIKLRLKGKKLN